MASGGVCLGRHDYHGDQTQVSNVHAGCGIRYVAGCVVLDGVWQYNCLAG